ncbi:hypothetical protein AL037_07490 [Salipiger aestuarii]|nr:hypothetical protein AL037_07490 [Salipiger aestuarii]
MRGDSCAPGLVPTPQSTVGARPIWRDGFPCYRLPPPDDPPINRDCIRPVDLSGQRPIEYADRSVSALVLFGLAVVTPPPVQRLRVHLGKSSWSPVEMGCGNAVVVSSAAHVHRPCGLIQDFSVRRLGNCALQPELN